jgi:hypothetical protein
MVKIIQTRIFQRLKGLSQNGLYGMIVVARQNKGLYPSRYEHSIGVAHLCSLLGASEEVQIMALLHDLYHTNFSHDVDYLYGGLQSFHEVNKDKFIATVEGMDELINILGKKDLLLSCSDIVKNKNCGADGLDYILRDSYYHHFISKEYITQLISHLTIIDGQITAQSSEISRQLVDISMRIDDMVYNGAENKGYNIMMSKLLRLSLDKSIITEDQLFYGYHSDDMIYRSIRMANDPEIDCVLYILQSTTFYYDKLVPGDRKKNSYCVKTYIAMRQRYLDPPYQWQRQDKSSPVSSSSVYHLWGILTPD